ncbi:MAG: hypothetical protein GF317_08340 [Candidatus Lokiarchaeota archaeon]|nr:hypothetical protein [Candidatus Lokiarchaeota archaeon]MBD3199720.1 hypothetical protein [Candidatus Lokiarchaeota archaeon]
MRDIFEILKSIDYDTRRKMKTVFSIVLILLLFFLIPHLEYAPLELMGKSFLLVFLLGAIVAQYLIPPYFWSKLIITELVSVLSYSFLLFSLRIMRIETLKVTLIIDHHIFSLFYIPLFITLITRNLVKFLLTRNYFHLNKYLLSSILNTNLNIPEWKLKSSIIKIPLNTLHETQKRHLAKNYPVFILKLKEMNYLSKNASNILTKKGKVLLNYFK